MQDTLVNPNKALWSTGDFTKIAERMRDSGEKLVATLGIRPGMDVLDLGCGDGTTALPEAELGANVVGVDLTPALVEAGKARAKAAGLDNIRFEEGDASNLSGLADESFDLVVSIFGAMFAPRPDDVTKEMVRVTRPGGRIAMGNWIPSRGDPLNEAAPCIRSRAAHSANSYATFQSGTRVAYRQTGPVSGRASAI